MGKKDFNQTLILSKDDEKSFLDFNNSFDLDYIIELLNQKDE